jgi:HK97 family phage prohead protease
MTFNHSPDSVLGRTKNGTLKLAEDSTGLAFRCQLDPNQQSHKDLHAAVKRKDISDCSFAFQCPEDGCDFNQRGVMEDRVTPCNIRTLRKVKLLDCSVVVHPAYPNTSVDARKLAPVSDQTEIKRQIAVFHARQKAKIADARSIAAEYSPLPFEEVVRVKKLGYSEDVVLALRSAAYARQIGGPTFEAGPMRYEPGQNADPTASLRDDDDFDWDDDDQWDKEEHERCAEFHRVLARKSSSWQQGMEQHKCADLHARAAAAYPSGSVVARAASKLTLGDVS